MVAEDDQDIPDTGAVFSFGKSKFADNEPSKFWIRNDRIQQIACGDEHTAVVTESGRTFVFGSNDWGQLGHNYPKPALKPSCVKALKHERVTRVACGRAHTVVATESQRLYGFGSNGDGQLGVNDVKERTVPTLISGLSANVEVLSAGSEHTIALTSDGQLYTFGGGCDGLLGGGDVVSVLAPAELSLGQSIVSVACGYYHTALVTADGKVYTMGEREAGKLGLPDDDPEQEGFVNKPELVEGIPERAVKVACGGKHTVVLTEEGKIYTFGDGTNGQLGLGTRTLESSSPQLVSAFANIRIKDIACGESNTAVISEKGTLFVFGDGRHGKLALGNDNFSNQFWPIKVSRFDNFKVEKVACGGCHMMVLAVLKSEEEMAEVEDVEPMPTGISDKSGLLDTSSSARSRRHQKEIPLSPIRSLPPLKISGKYMDTSPDELSGLDNEPGPSTEVAIAFLENQLKEVEEVKDLESIDLPEVPEESEASDIPELNESDINSNELDPQRPPILEEESELDGEDEETPAQNEKDDTNEDAKEDTKEDAKEDAKEDTKKDTNVDDPTDEEETLSQDNTRPNTSKQNVTPVEPSPVSRRNTESDIVFKPQRAGVIITVNSVEVDDTSEIDYNAEPTLELSKTDETSIVTVEPDSKNGKVSENEDDSEEDEDDEEEEDEDDDNDRVVVGKLPTTKVDSSSKSEEATRTEVLEIQPIDKKVEDSKKEVSEATPSEKNDDSTPKISPTAKKKSKGGFIQRMFRISDKNGTKEDSSVLLEKEAPIKSSPVDENKSLTSNKEEITPATPLPSGKLPVSPTYSSNQLKNRTNLSSLLCLPQSKMPFKPNESGDSISLASTSKPRSSNSRRSASPKQSRTCVVM